MDMRPRFLQTGDPLKQFGRLAIAIFLSLTIWHVTRMLRPSLALPWFTSSDENVLIADVIRFSDLDFRQGFFDMPGTPLMLLGAFEWRLYYFFAGLAHSAGAGLNLFTFQHLQSLFTLMRVDNLVFFILSALLLFRIVYKAANEYAGAAAALLLLMNAAYEGTVPLLRVEPIAMCFMLAAILVLSEFKSPVSSFWAGVLCGLGAACRLHSITASLPLLVLLLIFGARASGNEYSRAFARVAAWLAAGALLGSFLALYWFGFRHTALRAAFPFAFALLAKASLAAAFCIAALGGACLFPKTRRYVLRIVTPDVIRLLSGFALGLLFGMPTALRRYDAFLDSVNFYSSAGYADPVVAHLPWSGKVTSLFGFYSPLIFPDTAAMILFAAGTGLILILPRFRRLAPYWIVAGAFFVSKPLDLVRAAHHVALWIPFYAIVCAVPFAALADLQAGKNGLARYVAIPAAILALFWLRFELPDSSDNLRATMAEHLERTRNIESADAWISSQSGKDATVMIAFYCFDSEIFYAWFRGSGIKVPPLDAVGPRQQVWWGNRSALQGRSGLACLCEQDLPAMKVRRQLGQGLDPLRDPRFHLLQSFGQGLNQIDVLQFDFR